MKLKSFVSIVLIGASITMAKAQSCVGYAVSKKGATYVLTSYSKGDMSKIASVESITVTDNDGHTATLHKVSKDGKGKETINSSYSVSCDGDRIIIDQKTLLAQEMKKNITNPDVSTEVSGNNLEIPHQLSEGKSLPDSKIKVDLQAGTVKMDMKADIENRKVVGKETITVPAGTFECFVITDESTTKSLVVKKNTRKIWMAKGVGTVKMETYDKKGKLEKLQLLTAIN